MRILGAVLLRISFVVNVLSFKA